MKTIKLLGICLSIFLQAMGHSAVAQCMAFVKKVDFSQLDEYSYCGGVQSAQMYRSDSAEVDLKLEARTKYRILIEAQEYLGEIDLQLTGRADEVISIPLAQNEQLVWEIFSEDKKKITLKVKFKGDHKHKPLSNHMDASGCVVLAVGKIKLEELVERSELPSDL